MTAIVTLIVCITVIASLAIILGVRVEVPPRAGSISVQVGRINREGTQRTQNGAGAGFHRRERSKTKG